MVASLIRATSPPPRPRRPSRRSTSRHRCPSSTRPGRPPRLTMPDPSLARVHQHGLTHGYLPNPSEPHRQPHRRALTGLPAATPCVSVARRRRVQVVFPGFHPLWGSALPRCLGGRWVPRTVRLRTNLTWRMFDVAWCLVSARCSTFPSARSRQSPGTPR